MSDFLGARISLISRSDIRYVGILHEINSDESTVSLENVKSFGTEGRKGKPEEETPPSDQIYEYIVFRGTDVKDLRIEEAPKESKPPAVPNDPAIVGARPRPVNAPPGPPNPHGVPGGPGGPGGGPGFGYYPPQMGGWGRAGGPPPQPFVGMQYPPPPGWFPPGQGFPPPGAAPWGNYPAFPPGPGGPPGVPAPNNRQESSQTQEAKPPPIGASGDKKPSTPAQHPSLPTAGTFPGQPGQQQPTMQAGRKFPAQHSQAPVQSPLTSAPTPPVESKPTVEEVNATAASLSANGQSSSAAEPTKSIPTGPKGTTRPSQIMPAVPLPAALTAKSAYQSLPSRSAQDQTNNAAASAAALRDATQAAKAAVAVAMAKLETPGLGQQPDGGALDNLTKKVNETRVNAPRGGQNHVQNTRGDRVDRGGRGGGRAPRPAKVDVPDADFDFASSNAKFNKQEIVKEAIASGSPLGETTPNGPSAPQIAPDITAGAVTAPPAYNKTKSFFDNISSEARDRAENNGQKPGGREWRGEEQRKNMETFGQGSVDGGYRGGRGYRGRGRGRGGRGRGFPRGGRGGGGYRNEREIQSDVQ